MKQPALSCTKKRPAPKLWRDDRVGSEVSLARARRSTQEEKVPPRLTIMPTAVDNIAEQRAIASRLREMAEETRHHASRLRLIEAARWFEQDADVAERIERESSPPSKAGGAP